MCHLSNSIILYHLHYTVISKLNVKFKGGQPSHIFYAYENHTSHWGSLINLSQSFFFVYQCVLVEIVLYPICFFPLINWISEVRSRELCNVMLISIDSDDIYLYSRRSRACIDEKVNSINRHSISKYSI